MKVLFIVREIRMDQLGIMYLISAIKKAGHEVYLARSDKDDINKKINKIIPDYICYSVCSSLEKFFFELDDYIRKSNPNLRFKSIFGGPAVIFNTELFENKCYLRGECEEVLVKFIAGEKYQDLTLIDVNKISPPDRELIYSYPDLRNNPIKNMITRRGCKRICSYCFNNKWNKLHKYQHPRGIVRLRNIDGVIDEMIDLKKNWQPLRMIHIMDDDFIDSMNWLEEFIPLYKSKVNVPFICNACPKHLTKEIAKLLSEAGCEVVSFAIESANDENRTKVLYRYSAEKEEVIKALENCKKYNIRTRLLNMIGLPVPSSLEDAYETLDFSIKYKPTNSRCAILQCYKGTKLFEIAKTGGYIPENDLVDGFFETSTLNIKNTKQISRLHKLWPLITTYPFPLRFFTPLLLRLPIPFKFYKWIFNMTKDYLQERDLWKVY